MKTLYKTLFVSIFLSPLATFAQSSYRSDVAGLYKFEYREAFLKSVQEVYIKTSDFEDSIMVAEGFRSEKHLAAIDSLHKLDTILFKQMGTYLQLYGYPPRAKYGEKLSFTPYMVLSRCNVLSLKRKYYSTFYKAHQAGDLEQRRIIEYLQDLHRIQTGKEFKSYHQDERRLKELTKALNI